MKYRLAFYTLGLALAGCSHVEPLSGGVGFGNYTQHALGRAQRDAQLSGQNASSQGQQESAVSLAELNNAGIGAAVQSNTGAPLSALGRSSAQGSSLSDEQSFEAVSARETIVSDALRREKQANQLIVVDPVPLPSERTGAGANIVEYAINAPNTKGQEWYSRSFLSTQARSERNCATYATADDAQRDFLSRGGPERDSRGLDPDGDGFACNWDPEVYRSLSGQ